MLACRGQAALPAPQAQPLGHRSQPRQQHRRSRCARLRSPSAPCSRTVAAQSQHIDDQPAPSSRRTTLSLLAALATAPAAAPQRASAAEAAAEADTTVTHRLFLDVGVCPEAVRTDRKLGDKTPFCSDPQPLGRVVVDLYGKAAPGSVATLVAAAQAGAYASTSITKVLPGRFLLLGTQGPKRSGLVQAPPGLPDGNPDLLSSAAFRLSHRRPGTVSLNLSENEDDDFFRFDPKYRNLSLLITTGPGPVPSLDGENIVVGQVSEGLEVIAAITQVPTFTPNDNARAFNQFAKFIGDERAEKTARKWGRPLQAVVITNCGLL